MPLTLESFITRWSKSAAAERANKDAFILELCDVIDVPRPEPTTGDPEQDCYVFEHDAQIIHEGGRFTIGKIDLYKEGCLILEAKQGSESKAKKRGTARRDTPAWNLEMDKARGQALGYARTLRKPPPFLVVADIGYCFDIYACFDGATHYAAFPEPQSSRIFLSDLATHRDLLRAIFLEPHRLDPSLRAAKVTRDVAEHLAELAKWLESKKHPPERVAKFLMRCLFTMFSEDVGLLPDHLFQKAIKDYWLPNPKGFVGGVQSLWKAMNEGSDFLVGKLRWFNGGLFRDPVALPLDKDGLERLLEAAKCNWADVEPAIFGTLLERALDPDERHALGAHFTPRGYVERLVRPTIEEPLRADWEVVQAEVQQLVSESEKTKSDRTRGQKLAAAIQTVREFHDKLCKVKVLDPACGSGNFLYVSLDLFKRLEGEVLAKLAGLGVKQDLLHMETVRVTPAQFLGIEIKPWAKEIAELVLWIGYLQWHFRTYGKNLPVPEPVLQDYKNIECRDAVLTYDREELVLDAKGRPVTRWDGTTTKKHPVTGEEIPDEAAQLPLYHYVNPGKAAWPKADFVVGNPPYIGNKRMRAALGDGYVEALRVAYEELPSTIDLVMYWWHRAADFCLDGRIRRFGLITTNSISQSSNRPVLLRHLEAKQPLSIVFAVPDHPWVETADGAAVRVAMTVGEKGSALGRHVEVIAECDGPDGEVDVRLKERSGTIHADLSVGPAVAAVSPLQSNEGLCTQGVILVGEGFRLEESEFTSLEIDRAKLPPVVKPYMIGRDVVQQPQRRFVIDFHGYSEEKAKRDFPALYQRLFDTVRPLRLQNRDVQRKRSWWLFGRSNDRMRAGLENLSRYIATVETSKFKPFVFLDGAVLPDHKLYAIASDDALILGVLSSRVHQTWALAAGGTLEDRPTWTNGTCFLPFPFPNGSDDQQAQIRNLAERLDAHRKRQQALHPKLTLTGMYNVMEKIGQGEALNDSEKRIHEQGLISVLKQNHDALDAAVFDAYGWPHGITDEQILERLVQLNALRAEEERQGTIRWLRPEFQHPTVKRSETQATVAKADEAEPVPTSASVTWPKTMPQQIAAVRDLLLGSSSPWTAQQVAKHFKGAKRKNVEAILESLTTLGLLVAFQPNGEIQWKTTRASA